MKKLIANVLFACVCVGVVLADSHRASLNDPNDVAAVKLVEQDMGDAMVAGEIDELSQIFADDWATVGSSGKIVTKEKVLADFKSGKDKLVLYENGPIEVEVLGNVAVGHGSVKEKRIRDGKASSGEGVGMDLLEKRAGKWVVVRSGGAFVKSRKGTSDGRVVPSFAGFGE
jgi:hypothetical protein